MIRGGTIFCGIAAATAGTAFTSAVTATALEVPVANLTSAAVTAASSGSEAGFTMAAGVVPVTAGVVLTLVDSTGKDTSDTGADAGLVPVTDADAPWALTAGAGSVAAGAKATSAVADPATAGAESTSSANAGGEIGAGVDTSTSETIGSVAPSESALAATAETIGSVAPSESALAGSETAGNCLVAGTTSAAGLAVFTADFSTSASALSWIEDGAGVSAAALFTSVVVAAVDLGN